jgi:hypothetical protein
LAVAPRIARPEQLTAAWFTAVLGERFPGVIVDSVEIERIAEGTNRRATALLGYAAGGGPDRVFLKTPGPLLHRLALSVLGALNAEADLALSGVELPLEHARFLAAVVHPRRLGSVVVLEDVTERGGNPNAPHRALSLDEVADGLCGLAQLHAKYWARDMTEELAFVKPFSLGPVWGALSVPSLSRARAKLPSSLWPKNLGGRTLDLQFRKGFLPKAGPLTLLHGDPHPGNTYSLPGGKTGFYDWQLIRQGDFSHDLSYFLIGSLTVKERRDHEGDLIACYLAALGEELADRPTLAETLDRYRAAPSFGLATWLHTLSAGTFQEEDDCMAMIERFAAAYEDLGTLSISR